MRRSAWLVLVAALAAAPAARADNVLRVAIFVGETLEVDVGFARGYRCDDLSLIAVGLRTQDNANVFVAAGVRPGTTQCRVGTDFDRGSLLLEITVMPVR